MANDTSDMADILLVMVGVEVGAKGKQITGVIPLTQEEVDSGLLPDRSVAYFGGKAARALAKRAVGHVYSTRGTWDREGDGLSVQANGLVRVCPWPDAEQRQRWSVRDRAARAELERLKVERSEPEELHAALDVVRSEYRRAVGGRRVGMLAEVIRYITS